MRRTIEILCVAIVAFGLLGAPASLLAQNPVYRPQTSPGEIALEVQPRWQEGVLSFEIKATSHTVDLSGVNLLKSACLVVGDVTLEPVAAGSLSGHHASVTVRFQVPNRPDVFQLEIRDVPDVPVRVLRWPTAIPGGGGSR